MATSTNRSTRSTRSSTSTLSNAPARLWQQGRSITQSLDYMFQHQIGCDVQFIFESENGSTSYIKAHKLILSARSPVFETMFSGSFTEASGAMSEVKITDAEKDVFIKMLRYIYTDDMQANGDDVMHLLFLAQKYMLDTMTNLCTSFLKRSLTDQTVCDILNNALDFELHHLIDYCVGYILTHMPKISKGKDIYSLSPKALLQVVSRDDLDVNSEAQLHALCVKWAKTQISKRHNYAEGTVISTAAVRSELADVMKQIRYLAMSSEQFQKCISICDIFDSQEKIYFLTGSMPSSASKIYNTHERITSQRSFNRFHMISTSPGDVHWVGSPRSPNKSFTERFYITPSANVVCCGVSLLHGKSDACVTATVFIQKILSNDAKAQVAKFQSTVLKCSKNSQSRCVEANNTERVTLQANQQYRFVIETVTQGSFKTFYGTVNKINTPQTIKCRGVNFHLINRRNKAGDFKDNVGRVTGLLYYL